MDKPKNDWWVYSTAVGTGVIMVECQNTGARGIIRDYTKDEWAAAFYAPSAPYRWADVSRVELIGEGAPSKTISVKACSNYLRKQAQQLIRLRDSLAKRAAEELTPEQKDKIPEGFGLQQEINDLLKWADMVVELYAEEVYEEGKEVKEEGSKEGVFPKDAAWSKMKEMENREFKSKYPEFYTALSAKAKEQGLDIEEFFLEQISEEEDVVQVAYYPCAIDWNLEATWSISKGEILEFTYDDNGNNFND